MWFVSVIYFVKRLRLKEQPIDVGFIYCEPEQIKCPTLPYRIPVIDTGAPKWWQFWWYYIIFSATI
ncbi:hypothetical protein LA52FAK_18550 [Desulforhopalus sp. 52FAK]